MHLTPKRTPGRWLRALGTLVAMHVTVGCGRTSVGIVARDSGAPNADGGLPRVDAAQRPDAPAQRPDATAREDRPCPMPRVRSRMRTCLASTPARTTRGGRRTLRTTRRRRGTPPPHPDARSDGGADSALASPPALCQIAIQCDKTIPNEPKIACAFSLADGQGVSEFDDHAGVELHGRSSLSFPKKNYSIELRDATGATKATDLLQMGKESDWILDGMWADRSLMRNAMAFDTFRDLGGPHYAAKGRYCRLTLNGNAQGIYRLEEKIKRDDDCVVIAADDGTGHSFVIKQDSGGAAKLSVGDESNWELVYPNQEKATAAQLGGRTGLVERARHGA